jgi:hypothetical protein
LVNVDLEDFVPEELSLRAKGSNPEAVRAAWIASAPLRGASP